MSNERYEEYNEMLDEVYGTIQIGWARYYASDIWKENDPIAYELGYQDWLDAMAEQEQEEANA